MSNRLFILIRYGGTITNQIKRLGASCDWKREHFTLDEQLSRKAFFYLVEIQSVKKLTIGYFILYNTGCGHVM